MNTTRAINASDITITNTKGYTGHTLGAAIEDAVLVKALQKHQVPPIAKIGPRTAGIDYLYPRRRPRSTSD